MHIGKADSYELSEHFDLTLDLPEVEIWAILKQKWATLHFRPFILCAVPSLCIALCSDMVQCRCWVRRRTSRYCVGEDLVHYQTRHTFTPGQDDGSKTDYYRAGYYERQSRMSRRFTTGVGQNLYMWTAPPGPHTLFYPYSFLFSSFICYAKNISYLVGGTGSSKRFHIVCFIKKMVLRFFFHFHSLSCFTATCVRVPQLERHFGIPAPQNVYMYIFFGFQKFSINLTKFRSLTGSRKLAPVPWCANIISRTLYSVCVCVYSCYYVACVCSNSVLQW